MILHISKLKSGENHFHYPTTDGNELGGFLERTKEQGYDVHPGVELDVHLTRLEPEYFLRGKLQFTVDLPCSRCAEESPVALEHPFELGLVHAASKPALDQEVVGGREEIEALDLNYFTGPTLDLAPIVEEQFHLSLPFQPLCSESCGSERGAIFWKDPGDVEEESSAFSALKELKIKKS